MVAYNGLINRSKSTEAGFTAAQTKKQLTAYQVVNNAYPADLSSFNLPNNSANNYQYTQTSGGQGFCLTSTVSGVSYWTSESQTNPAAGACPGHGLNGQSPVTNLAYNPSFELNLTGVNVNRSNHQNPSDGTAYAGNKYLRNVRTSAPGHSGPWWDATNVPVIAGHNYYVQMHLRASATVNRTLSIEWIGSGRPSSPISIPTLTTSWQRVSGTVTAPAGVTVMRPAIYTTDGPIGEYVDVDGVIIVDSGQSNFADGNTPNWVWNGTTNLSTSTGSPL